MLTARDGILMDRGRGSLQHNCLTGIPIYGPIYIYIYMFSMNRTGQFNVSTTLYADVFDVSEVLRPDNATPLVISRDCGNLEFVFPDV